MPQIFLKLFRREVFQLYMAAGGSLAAISPISMSEIKDYGVTVEEYLEGLEKGINILELRSLEEWGIPTDLAKELMSIMPSLKAGTATPEEVVRSLMIMSPPLRQVKKQG